MPLVVVVGAVAGASQAQAWGFRSHTQCLNSIRVLSSLHSSQSQQQQQQHGQQRSGRPSLWGLSSVAAAAAGLLFWSTGTAAADTKRAAAKPKVDQQQKSNNNKKADGTAGSLPEYTADEVAQHRTPKDRVWVTYKDGVYDITDFIAQV